MLRTLTPVLALILAIVVYFYFTKPIIADITVLRDDLVKFEGAISKADEVQNELKNLVAQRNAFDAEDMQRLNALVPKQIDEVKILADLKQMSLDRTPRVLMGNFAVTPNTVLIDDSASGVDESVVNYADMHYSDISFSIIGSYESLKQLLRDIERSLVLLDVINVSLGTAGTDLMQFDITVRTYALPDVKQLNEF